MVVPARVVADHGLRFYREPWEAAIGPQMGFQIAAAPLNALGYPDASNVLSVCFAGMLAWFAGSYIGGRAGVMASAVLLVGMSATTLYSAAGPHALGDLACVAIVLAALSVEKWREPMDPISLIAMVSILAVAGAMTKVPFAPLCIGVAIYTAARIWQGRSCPWHQSAAFVLPWIIFYLPLLAWTWASSGSPLGPLLAGKLGWSAYDVPQIRQFLAEARAANRLTLKEAVLTPILYYSPACGSARLYSSSLAPYRWR